MEEQDLKLTLGRKYTFVWKGIFGMSNQYEGIFKRTENKEYLFDIPEIGELPFEAKELIKIMEEE